MRIVDLLSKEKILLHTSAADKNAAIDLMVGLQEKGGALTDKEAYKQAILAREAQSSTAIEAGIAVPHAKAGCVREPSLAAVTLDRGLLPILGVAGGVNLGGAGGRAGLGVGGGRGGVR